MNFRDLTILCEEMGRAVLPGPFLQTVLLVGMPILTAGTEEQKKEYLPRIASGDMVCTLAVLEEDGDFWSDGVQLKATQRGNDYILSGTKLFVNNAKGVDYMLVAARTRRAIDPEDGITLFLVDTRTAGISIQLLKTMTGEKQCEVIFDKVRVPKSQMLGELHQGWPIVQRLMTEAAVAECAWMTGGARWVMEDTIEYTKERIAFGRPIGSFQAVQHKLAFMAVEVEGSTSIMYYAAWALSENDPAIALAASMAKAWCSESYKHATFDGVQLHGGIGFTWDHDMHLYFKIGITSKSVALWPSKMSSTFSRWVEASATRCSVRRGWCNRVM